eukprot:6489457-Amphidinium_carterae.2
MHQPVCWWTAEEDLIERLQADDDTDLLRYVMSVTIPRATVWKQARQTPPRYHSPRDPLHVHEREEDAPMLVEGGANHIAAFRTALRVLNPNCLALQDLIYCVERITRQKALASSNNPPPLLACIAQVDSLLGDWAVEHPLRRDFIRGALLDLILLAEQHGTGITLIDDKGVSRWTPLRLATQPSEYALPTIASSEPRSLHRSKMYMVESCTGAQTHRLR